MKKQTFLTLLLIVVCTLGLISRSSGPGFLQGQRVSGAPGDSGTCSNCHFGGTTAGGSINIQDVGGASGYIPGQSYTMQVTIIDPDAQRGGFQAVALDGSNLNVGTITAGTGNRVVPLAGRNYIEHNTPRNFSAGQVAWTFTWQAPNTNVGPVTFYTAGNAATGGGTGGDAIFSTSFSFGTLPVEISHFSAIRNGLAATLAWQTEKEINSDYFEVQRSTDGEDFEAIGVVSSVGNSQGAQEYAFDDLRPLYNVPLFYRLKEVDLNGQVQFSRTVEVTISQHESRLAAVFPVPAILQEEVIVDYVKASGGDLTLSLADISGRQWYQATEAYASGRHLLKVPVRNLPSGKYYLLITDREERIFRTIVIAN